jgi:hypothetical protein
MWKLHAIRFAALLALMVAAVTVNTMVNGPRPTEAAPMADDRPIAGETAMQSLAAEPRYTADGKYIAVKAPTKVKTVKATKHRHKVKHHVRHHAKHHVRHVVKHHAKRHRVKAAQHHKMKAAPARSTTSKAGVRHVTHDSKAKAPMTLAEKKERCTPDVIRLCAAEIPNRDKIVACLKANRAQLSKACAPVFADATPFHMRS